MSRADFVSQMVELGRDLSGSGGAGDLHVLVALGHRLLTEDQPELQSFVDRIVKDPDALRERWMGHTALRRSRLSGDGRQMLRVLGLSPDLLEPGQRRFDERLHTDIIAWALSDRVSFSTETRSAFVEMLRGGLPKGGATPLETADQIDVGDLRVLSERPVPPFGRVDVWMESATHVIAVEAKVGAAEGFEQTDRYHRAASSHGAGRKWIVAFLTLVREQDPSGPAIHVTFEQLLIAWLPVAVSGRTGQHRVLALYLASLARINHAAGVGSFDDWTFLQRRRGLNLVESTKKGPCSNERT